MWAFARQHLGISSDEFWRITPREFDALARSHLERERMLNYRAGLAAAAIYNVNRDKHKPPVGALDFFEQQNSSELRVMTAEQIKREMDRAWRICKGKK